MAHPDAKPMIDGEVDSHLEHLRFINDEVGLLGSATSSPLSSRFTRCLITVSTSRLCEI